EPAVTAVNLRVAAHLRLEQKRVVVEQRGDEDGSTRAPFLLPVGDGSDGSHFAAKAFVRICSCLQNDRLTDAHFGDFCFGDGDLRRDPSQLMHLCDEVALLYMLAEFFLYLVRRDHS